MWSKFREIDLGDNLDEALEDATYYVRDKKEEKFGQLGFKGTALIKTFEGIESCIKDIEELIDEIKESMIKKTVLQNIDQIETTNKTFRNNLY